MARLPNFENISTLLQYYISQYYIQRERNKSLKHETEKHKKVIEELSSQYQVQLRRKFPDQDTEQNKYQFKKEIDFLTQIFSNEEKERRRGEYVKSIFKQKPH